MILRKAKEKVKLKLQGHIAIILTGLPRVGRSELARSIASDLEDGAELETSSVAVAECNLIDPITYCSTRQGRVLIIDEIGAGDISAISKIVRASERFDSIPPRFILLAADTKTTHRLQNSLTGLASCIELPPVQLEEYFDDCQRLDETHGPISVGPPVAASVNALPWRLETHWLRGGLPQSLLANSDKDSFDWRRSYIESLLRCDLSRWQLDASDRVEDILLWIANNNGHPFNMDNCTKKVAVKKESVRKTLKFLQETGVVRELRNWPARSNASISIMSTLYIRDCGLLHAYIGIITEAQLNSSDARGHSWEGFAIETLIEASGSLAIAAYYRDERQNEIDLILDFCYGTGDIYAIEFKTSESSGVRRGFAVGCQKIGATHRMVVHSGGVSRTSAMGVQSLSLLDAVTTIRNEQRPS